MTKTSIFDIAVFNGLWNISQSKNDFFLALLTQTEKLLDISLFQLTSSHSLDDNFLHPDLPSHDIKEVITK